MYAQYPPAISTPMAYGAPYGIPASQSQNVPDYLRPGAQGYPQYYSNSRPQTPDFNTLGQQEYVAPHQGNPNSGDSANQSQETGRGAVEVKQLSYVVGDKTILKDITVTAGVGRVLAVMGPSGAGKTTFFNCIAGRAGNGKGVKQTGDIYLHGKKSDPDDLRKTISVVTQDDILYNTMTPEEILKFAARIKAEKKLTPEESKERVEDMLTKLNLQRAKHTRIGTPGLTRGVSGGERKRVNIASEVIGNPAILLLDEPTTGLDSVSAFNVAEILRKLAREEERTIIMTIHQPSSDIYELFDDLLLLEEGRVVYSGAADKAVEYFDSLGLKCPKNFNPSDYIMYQMEMNQKLNKENTKHAQKEAADEEEERRLAEAPEVLKEAHLSQKWTEADWSKYQVPTPAPKREIKQRKPAPKSEQFKLLMWRAWHHSLRDRATLGALIGQTLFFSGVLCGIFNQIPKNQAGVQDMQGLIFTVVMQIIFVAVFASVLSFSAEKPVFLREQGSSLYTPSIYFLAKYVSEFPIQAIFPLVLGASTYWACGLDESPGRFFVWMGMNFLGFFTGRALGLIVSAAAPTFQLAMAFAPLIVVPMIFGAGLVASVEVLGGFWIWLKYISLMRYVYVVVAKVEFQTWDCISCSNDYDTCSASSGSIGNSNYGFNYGYGNPNPPAIGDNFGNGGYGNGNVNPNTGGDFGGYFGYGDGADSFSSNNNGTCGYTSGDAVLAYLGLDSEPIWVQPMVLAFVIFGFSILTVFILHVVARRSRGGG